MERTYHYLVAGEAADNQTWRFEGRAAAKQGDFVALMMEILGEAFNGLTDGKAVYGHPGKGCSGPYTLTTFHIEAVSDDA